MLVNQFAQRMIYYVTC